MDRKRASYPGVPSGEAKTSVSSTVNIKDDTEGRPLVSTHLLAVVLSLILCCVGVSISLSFSVHLSLYLCLSLSVCLSLFLCAPVYLCVCVCLSVPLINNR